ncbi:MAG: hypothetical protein QCI38_07460, partial [Candidatus Thermoplasmatota archaeon]|nr:hypothetical protein [Candidatus Thermoplasmatota archaeon]
NFCAKVRPDSVAKHPDIIKKMISVGIASYEMGIESPSIKDIKNTSKGLDTNVHTKAVESIKKWGGSPGGTFVVGLPDHTEEEILQFPLYAKKLGLTSSAYGVVTPFPGTKFYEELDSQGVIFEKDWNRFDEMHSVFKMKNISSPRIEELASICMAKFWTIDTFIEQERVRTLRTGTTTPLKKFLADRLYNLKFGVGSGAQLQEGNFRIHAQKFIEASPDPSIREYTERVGMHNVIEMTSFLKLLGTQTVQITVKKGEAPLASWVFKTTRHAVEYVDVIPGKIEDSTINFDVDLESFKMDGTKASRSENIRIMLKIMKSNKGLKRQFNLMRLLIASGFEMIR